MGPEGYFYHMELSNIRKKLIDIFFAISYNTIRDGAIRHRKYCSHTVCD